MIANSWNFINLVIVILFPYIICIHKLHTEQFVKMYNYPCETHYITTEDGYILTYHRIPHGIKHTTTNGLAVLISHGLGSSSADSVNLGPKRGLGFILADAGYDVWLGNSRGNSYSRNHTTLDFRKDAKRFFDFSWHEMGIYDLPASIDYILSAKKVKSLHYIGYSQGGTSFLVFASSQPEYAKKIKLATLIAPASTLEHHPDLTKKVFASIYQFLMELKKDNVHDLPGVDLIQNFLMSNCQDDLGFIYICRSLVSLIGGGADDSQLDNDILRFVGMNTPNSLSLKQAFHYIQLILNGGFTEFDYGPVKNKKLYGKVTPPEYNLSNITVPIALYIGQNDGIAGFDNMPKLINRLPLLVHYYVPPHQLFNHVDFVVARDVVKLAFNEILKIMKQYD